MLLIARGDYATHLSLPDRTVVVHGELKYTMLQKTEIDHEYNY